MSEKQQARCGTWPSDIDAGLVASSSVRYANIIIDGEDLYWLEGRPEEKGRTAIVRRRTNQIVDVLSQPWNVRSRVHEYGGGALAVYRGQCWFVNDADQQIYTVVDDNVSSLTNEPGCRFADLVHDPVHHCLYAVREDHRDGSGGEPANALVRIDCSDGNVSVIADGDDFYASPVLKPDGTQLAWLSWRHPNMPWDETVLWLADIQPAGDLTGTRKVAHESRQSVFQPEWSPDGMLYFVADPKNWWQLHRLDPETSQTECVCDYEAEIGLPLWQFGMRTYDFQDERRVIATLCEQGSWRLVKICTYTGEVEPLAFPYNSFISIRADERSVALIASGSQRADEVVLLDINSGERTLCSQPSVSQPGTDWLSQAEAISFPTSNNAVAHAFYYAPLNPEYEPMSGECPPLLVMSHGGPTGATSSSLSMRIQFWTSRGFAVLDVNYRGSTGYGRSYREMLKGQWGIYDVDDVVAGANYLVEQGLVDPDRLAIRGSSAGGFTTLAALTFRDTFSVGASYYGIGDLESLLKDTHKFEARYLDRLIGTYPEAREIYNERSPLQHTDQLSCPIIFLQGAEDKVVPVPQAEQMAAAMKRKNVPYELLIFEGEQHGFRKSETLVDALHAELNFYNRSFQ